MGGFKPLALMVAALAATAVGSSPARGQCRLCEQPTTAPVDNESTDDIKLDNMAQAYVLRAQVAHANIRKIDVTAARRKPGVYTGRGISRSFQTSKIHSTR